MPGKLADCSTGQPEDALLDFLLLGVLAVVNFFALRWCVQQLAADSEWLRDPEEREGTVREFALDSLRRFWDPYQRDGLTSNALYRLLSWLLLIVVIFGPTATSFNIGRDFSAVEHE